MVKREDRAVGGAGIVKTTGLVYVSDALPGIRRTRRNARFVYTLPDNRRLTHRAELQRIARLAIPPAYEDVWICMDPCGHLQATGRDARGRKQYRYHPLWRSLRDGEKFHRMPAFGESLPRMRRTARKDLALRGLPREKVLAIVVSLLDATRLRIGNVEYERSNESYGLTTLRNRHVKFTREGQLVFRFRGKGGAEHAVAIDDKRLVALVRRCHQLPGQRLFQYVDDAGEVHPVDSGQVNQYLRQVMGQEFTAKDFRTWGATLRAVEIMSATPLPEPSSERALAGRIMEAVRRVAAELRNTAAVCRKSYINPLVFDAWRSGALHGGIGQTIAREPGRAERLVPQFLRQQARAAAKMASAKRTLRLSASKRRRVLRAGTRAPQARGATRARRAPASALA